MGVMIITHHLLAEHALHQHAIEAYPVGETLLKLSKRVKLCGLDEGNVLRRSVAQRRRDTLHVSSLLVVSGTGSASHLSPSCLIPPDAQKRWR